MALPGHNNSNPKSLQKAITKAYGCKLLQLQCTVLYNSSAQFMYMYSRGRHPQQCFCPPPCCGFALLHVAKLHPAVSYTKTD